VGDFQPFSEDRQHARQYLQPQVFLITQPIRSPLDDADLVVEPFNEAERHFVLGLAVSSDALPMTINHVGELLVRFEALPLEAGAPVLEEASCPAFFLIAPQLAEGFLQEIRRIEPLVRGQQGLQGLAAIEVQVLTGKGDATLFFQKSMK
jgi:hypothetical protein